VHGLVLFFVLFAKKNRCYPRCFSKGVRSRAATPPTPLGITLKERLGPAFKLFSATQPLVVIAAGSLASGRIDDASGRGSDP
jgi:hypothetical protein